MRGRYVWEPELYRCNDCGAIFENPKEWIEYHNVGGLRDGWYKEPMSGCPVCYSGDFDEYREEDEDEDEISKRLLSP